MASETIDAADALAPEEAFGVLGNATRIAILRALWEADGPIGFADLRREVGATDSGGFNYHLDRLEGQFVERTPDGYQLRTAGELVVRAVVAGAFTQDVSFGPVEIDGVCPHCGSPVEASYSDEVLSVRCTDETCRRYALPDAIDPLAHGAILQIDVPPAALAGRTPSEVAAAATAWFDSKFSAVVAGVCPECAGRVERTVDVCVDHEASGEFCDQCESLYGVWATDKCEVCRFEITVPAWVYAIRSPAVIAFFEANGIEVTPLTWELFAGETIRPAAEEPVSIEPLEYRLTFAVADRHLDVTVGEDLRVTDVSGERDPRGNR